MVGRVLRPTIPLPKGTEVTLHGYCQHCHRIKRVRVSGVQMTQLAMKQTLVGVCLDCELKEVEAARARHPSSRRLT